MNSSANTHSPLRILDDELGKLIKTTITKFTESASWEEFIQEQRLEPPDLASSVGKLPHPAASLLHHLRCHGAPIPMMTGPWTEGRKQMAIERGPHQSSNEYKEFVREEFTDFVQKQFWTILPYELIKHMTNLRLSPLGVVPQRERRPRLIVDLSYFGINQECLSIAPNDAMQFGRALQRLLYKILIANPAHGPVYLSKIDIADSFYRLRLAPRDIPKLGVLLPRHEGESAMVAFPMVLPMGWVNSPPYFCAATETAADLMNGALAKANPAPIIGWSTSP